MAETGNTTNEDSNESGSSARDELQHDEVQRDEVQPEVAALAALAATNVQGFAAADMEKVLGALGDMWEHRDQVVDLIQWFGRYKDRVVSMVKDLPDLIATAGGGMGTAGDSAQKAAAFLVGGGDGISAKELTEIAAKALATCREELGNVRDLIAHLGDEIDDLRIPTVEAKFAEIGGIRVIKGIDIGESKLTDQAADRLRQGAERLTSISDALDTVSGHLSTLGGKVTEAGESLGTAGEYLTRSGAQLQSLMGAGSNPQGIAGTVDFAALGLAQPVRDDDPTPAKPKKTSKRAAPKSVPSIGQLDKK